VYYMPATTRWRSVDMPPAGARFDAKVTEEYRALLEQIEGIHDEAERRRYASVLLVRLMFVTFLQRNDLLGERYYLQKRLDESKRLGSDLYYARFLRLL